MEIKELRVGNKIWRPCCYDEVVEIRENGIIGLDSLRGLIPYSEIKPIPITDELLLKIGFVGRELNSIEQVYYNRQYGCVSRLVFKDYCTLINIDKHTVLNNVPAETVFMNEMCLKGRIHLHTLQNIWHLLTGKELEIKL